VFIPLVFLRLNLLLQKLPGKALSIDLSKITFHTGKVVSISLNKIGYMGKYIVCHCTNAVQIFKKKSSYRFLQR